MRKTLILLISLGFLVIAGYNLKCASSSSDVSKSSPQGISNEKFKEISKQIAQIGEEMAQVFKECKRNLEQLKTSWWSFDDEDGPTGWSEYYKAITFLHEGGDWEQTADLFDKVVEVAKKYPDPNVYWYIHHEYARESKELTPLLRKMAEEDKDWKEPADVSKLPLNEQIDYYIYKLRDIDGDQGKDYRSDRRMSLSPGIWCAFFSPVGSNAAAKLIEIGKPAVPVLINLLNDRRPTRAVGGWQGYHPSRYMLRYQDAAIQILEAIRQKGASSKEAPYYLSIQRPEQQQKRIEEIKSWWQKTKEKSKGE